MMNCFWRILKEEEGVSSIEYCLLLLFIALVIFGAVTTLGLSLSAAYQSVASQFP